MSDNIPYEIQMEIMKRLPVKSLFQCRSVSKSWKSLIDSTRFIADYNVCQNRPQRLFVRYMVGSDCKHVCIVDDDFFPQHKFDITVPTSFEVKYFHDLRLVGSSQGLLCLLGRYGEGKSTAFIWNPAIRKWIAIDVPVRQDFFIRMPILLGFGVCPNTNEPMLVSIDGYTNETSRPTELVFTLTSRVWRRRRSNLPRESDGFRDSQVAIDGFIYWETDRNGIVSIDMTSEEFSVVSLPDGLAHTSPSFLRQWGISKLRESLVVLAYDYTDTKKPLYVVWKMENGVSKSFTKLFLVIIPEATFVLGFRNNGEYILIANTGALQAYEPCSLHIKDLGIHGEAGSFLMSSYTETLLLLDEADNQHIEIKIV